jgi:hypothetical protein
MHPEPVSDANAVFQVVSNARQVADKQYPPKRPVNETPAALTAHLDAIREAVVAGATEWGFADHSTVRALQDGLSKIRCEDCSREAGAMACNGGLRDSFVLAKAGHCWRPFTVLFEHLVNLAQRLYADVKPLQGRHLCIRFITQITDGSITGATIYPDDDSCDARVAHVIIDLPAETLNEIHLGRLPYILFHEIFVHGPENWGVSGPRTPCGEGSAFREGFMDRAAYLWLREHLEKKNPLPHPFEFASTWAIKVAEQAHISRSTIAEEDVEKRGALARHSTVSSIETGKTVFDGFCRLIKTDRAVRFAARMNTIAFSVEEQSDLLVLLAHAAAAINWDGQPIARGAHWIAAKGELEKALGEDDDVLRSIIAKAVDNPYF